MNAGRNRYETVGVVAMQLVQSKKIYSWIGKEKFVSVTYIEAQVAARNTGSTTSNNEPKMPT